MHYREFVEYLEENLHNKDAFFNRAMAYQKEKNKARQKANRWDQIKLDRAVERMWNDVTQNIYNTIQPKVDKNPIMPEKPWLDFFEKNNLLESIDDSLVEIEFE